MALENGKPLVVISGGTRGLGASLSLRFGRAGYSVLALYSQDREEAEKLERQFSDEKLAGEVRLVDITQPDATQKLALDVRPTKLVLINNAAARFEPKPLHLTEWDEYERGFLVSVRGALHCCRAYLPLMSKAREGTIVNVLSSAIDEKKAPKGMAPYLASKQALLGLTRSMASETGALGVRVFSVSPPFMDTSFTRHWGEAFRSLFSKNGSTDPDVVAERIFSLVEGETPGAGEHYSIAANQ